MTDFFSSTDAVRSAKPLQHARSVTFDEPLHLERGGRLPRVTVCYETYGTLNLDKSNAVLVCHALSGDSHVARHDESDDPGWWDTVVGPGRPIDTDKYHVICPNILGGCRGTTGPSQANPATGKPYGGDFPVVTMRDMVDVQRRLIDHLGIKVLLAVVGGSMGGHMALTWATAFPGRVRGSVVLASCARLTNQSLGFDIVGRNAIIRDPNYSNGDYYNAPNGGPTTGLAVARMLAHITYLSHESMAEKFEGDRLQPRKLQTDFETKFSVGSYLAYQGHRFVERFDANSYITLTTAMDLFDLGNTPQKLAENLKQSSCRWLIVSFSTDWLFPPFQSEDMVNALVQTNRPVTYCEVESGAGHDAFLLPDDLDRYGELIRAFLANLACVEKSDEATERRSDEGEGRQEDQRGGKAGISRQGDGGTGGVASASLDPSSLRRSVASSLSASDPSSLPNNSPDCADSPTSIFHGDRLDYDVILDLIPPHSSVLDLGCGSGRLLEQLRRRDGDRARLLGVELDEQKLVACARRGVDAIRLDLNKGLSALADNHFDAIVLSQTLQTIREVEKILADCLRVARRTIVSFPNIAYAPLRKQLMDSGHAPRGTVLQGSNWYDTPNIRFLSIADFEAFCREKKVRILDRIALETTTRRRVTDDPNLNADLAIFVISR